MRRLVILFLYPSLILIILGLGIVIFSPKPRRILQSLPQYPNSTFLSTFQTSWPDDYPSDGVRYKTTDNPDQILDFYRRELLGRGWILEEEIEAFGGEHQGQLHFSKERCTFCIRREWDLEVLVRKVDSFYEESGELIISIWLEKM